MHRYFILLLLVIGILAVLGNGCNSDLSENGSPDPTEAEIAPSNLVVEPEPKPDAVVPTSKKRDDELHVITFEDLNIGMQEDMPFRPLMLDYEDGRARKLIGKRINVGGYMNPTDDFEGVKEFILLKNLDCKFGPGGQADHLVRVLLQGDETTNFTDEVIYVEGELELKPYPEHGPTWSIYDLKATKVSTRRPPRDRR